MILKKFASNSGWVAVVQAVYRGLYLETKIGERPGLAAGLYPVYNIFNISGATCWRLFKKQKYEQSYVTQTG
jgi:hypothetical protein